LDTLLGCFKLLLLLGLCYAAGASLFASRQDRASAGLAVVWFTAGFCLLSFVFLLSKVTGSALVFFAGLPVALVALFLLRRPQLRTTAGNDAGVLAWAMALVVLSAIPVLIMGVRMGAGDYPAEFFAGDSPFFLQQVYALLRTESYPPPSLETYNFAFKYHYGFQAFVALTSLLTGLKPHFVMFGVVHPLLELLTGILVYDICRRLTGHRNAALLCLFLVLFGSRQYLFTFQILDPSWWAFVTHEENFNFRFPNGPDAAGLLISLCAIRCALEFDRRNLRMAALFFICMLPVFKIPYLIPVGAGIGLIYGYELSKQFSPRLLAEICGTAVLSGLVYLVFSHNPAAGSISAQLQFAGFVSMSMPWDNETLLISVVTIIAAAAATRHFLSRDSLKLFIFALAPYLLFSLWRLDVENEYQIFSLAARLVAVFMAVYLVSAWLQVGRHAKVRHAAFLAVLAVLTVPGVISLVNHIHVVAVHPERGHEYVDNRSVADALMHIPLRDTLIITNDARYPAGGYARDYRQFQLAGIFGHRNFGANLVYGGFRETDRNGYARILQWFQLDDWPAAQIGQMTKKIGITHLLIHKNYAHAAAIPMVPIYENENYRVYRF
jgi:hypothetical protein